MLIPGKNTNTWQTYSQLTQSQNPNEFSFIKRNDPFLMLQTFQFFPSVLAFTKNHPQKTSKSYSSCAATAARATSCLLCRKRARVFNAGAVAVAVPRRTRARAAAGVSNGCRKETSGEEEDFGRIWTTVFVWCPSPPQKKNCHERQFNYSISKPSRIWSVVKLEGHSKQLILM